MKRVKVDPFSNLILDKEEQDIEKALERGEFEDTKKVEQTKKMFTEAAKLYRELNRSKRVTLRVNYTDLLRVKAQAARKRIPYQRLLGILIHKYAEGNARVEL